MTAVLFDGFDLGDAVHRWTAAGSNGIVTSPVRTGTHSYLMSSLGTLYVALDTVDEDDIMYVGFGFWRQSAFGTGDQVVLDLSENFGGTVHISLVMKPAIRGWEVRLGTGGAALIAVSPNVFFPDSWHHIELGVKIHNSSGWAELRQDGVTIGRFDGDTNNGGTDLKIDQVRFSQVTGGPTYNVDDVSIVNEQGSVNNSWLGDTRCYPLYPNGNGTSSTPLQGSDGNSVDNYLLVDESGTPVTTDYVFSSTDGDQDTYLFQNLPVTLGTIRGVEVRMHAAKSDTGTKQIRAITRRLATDSFGPDHVLAAIPLYQTLHDIDELDPHAGPGAWTIDNVNSTEWGAEVRP